MEKYRCKICSKRFSNGRAMGGHMRSHLAKLPIPPKPPQQQPRVEFRKSAESTPSPTSSFSNQEVTFKAAKKNYPNKSILSPDSDFTLHDRESETESLPLRNLTRKRSKRTRRVMTPPAPPLEPEATTASSVCDIISEEELAFCLIMMSRDRWTTRARRQVEEQVPDEEEEEEEEDEDEDEDEDEEEDSLYQTGPQKQPTGMYKCETCKKVFRSYQALGGHRASHKKIKTRNHGDDDETSMGGGDIAAGEMDRPVFECTVCYKVFDSGQALGGHKKVHFSNPNVASTSTAAAVTHCARATCTKIGELWIDLNLPAPEAEEEEEEDSTVSNAEVFNGSAS